MHRHPLVQVAGVPSEVQVSSQAGMGKGHVQSTVQVAVRAAELSGVSAAWRTVRGYVGRDGALVTEHLHVAAGC